MEQPDETDLWISAYNMLPPVSPVHMHRAGFDEAFATDAHLHAQWQFVLAAVDAPPRFEASAASTSATRTSAASTPAPSTTPAPPPPASTSATRTSAASTPAPSTTPAPPPPAPSRLSDVWSFDSAPVHARSVAKFIRQLLRSHNEISLGGQFFSLGEVATYFNHFMVDVHNHGPYTCPQLAAMYLVPVENLHKVWTFRPGAQSFTRKQAAVTMKLTVSQLMHAYHALGFKTWLLST